MGRRKIEIQPITHERNRSVTFLKRKNGLFKKAYELGVLCSVDVAVIIFEERPGHHLKLYQYCSSDISDMVQRHLRHDGEKDTRGPSDFSGNVQTGPKMDGVGGVDDDDGDDDGDDIMMSRGGASKRRGDERIKSEILNTDLDYIPRMPMHAQSAIGLSPSMSMSQHQHHQHPISSDRLGPVHHHQSKRPRLNSPPPPHSTQYSRLGHQPQSRSPSDDAMAPSTAGPVGGYTYPSQNFHPPIHHSLHHQPSQYPQYTPLSHSHGHATPPTPSFIPLQSDFSSRPRGISTSSSGSFLPTARSTSGSGYGGIYARGSNTSGGGGGGSGQPPDRGGGPANRDLFTAYLDAEEHHRVALARRSSTASSSTTAAPAGFSLDWPVHVPPPASAPPSSHVGQGNTSADRGDIRTPVSTSGGGRGGNRAVGGGEGAGVEWLDFLSGSSPSRSSTSAAPTSTSSVGPPTSTSSSTSTTWEHDESRGAGSADAMSIDSMALFRMNSGDVKKDPGAA
ncbi:Myocyte-specific enhancer factor 2D [Hypsizygus marmoreus]|uniref:Myocyte-specific enhancer factor 2D n=1 Tax=Hypsizygus marmoreus TaxID=39966 RepID=A0A369J9R4_HYPMA|nr:Myocyte-specific enhancer factor 2D [Hypsizygus marmoreus]